MKAEHSATRLITVGAWPDSQAGAGLRDAWRDCMFGRCGSSALGVAVVGLILSVAPALAQGETTISRGTAEATSDVRMTPIVGGLECPRGMAWLERDRSKRSRARDPASIVNPALFQAFRADSREEIGLPSDPISSRSALAGRFHADHRKTRPFAAVARKGHLSCTWSRPATCGPHLDRHRST